MINWYRIYQYPVKIPLNRLALYEQNILQWLVNKLINVGFIIPSNSVHTTPVKYVNKAKNTKILNK